MSVPSLCSFHPKTASLNINPRDRAFLVSQGKRHIFNAPWKISFPRYPVTRTGTRLAHSRHREGTQSHCRVVPLADPVAIPNGRPDPALLG